MTGYPATLAGQGRSPTGGGLVRVAAWLIGSRPALPAPVGPGQHGDTAGTVRVHARCRQKPRASPSNVALNTPDSHGSRS